MAKFLKMAKKNSMANQPEKWPNFRNLAIKWPGWQPCSSHCFSSHVYFSKTLFWPFLKKKNGLFTPLDYNLAATHSLEFDLILFSDLPHAYYDMGSGSERALKWTPCIQSEAYIISTSYLSIRNQERAKIRLILLSSFFSVAIPLPIARYRLFHNLAATHSLEFDLIVYFHPGTNL